MKENHPSAGGESRRSFLKKAAAATAAVATTGILKTPVYGQSSAPSVNVQGANEKLVIGFVGVGGQGTNAHVKNIAKFSGENNVAGAATCDVSKHRTAEAAKILEAVPGASKVEQFGDYRRLLERKDIDIIFCATVDHWHTRVCVDAMNAGKHVYVEKPMTRYLGEAFQIHDTVKKTGKILQVGSQGCSDRKWHKAAEWIKAGKIGPAVMAQGSYMRNNAKGEWNYAIQQWCTQEDVNWKMWIGDQIKQQKAFNPDDYFRWRKYYPYCAGLLGDLFPHKLHPYMLATGNPEFPTRVACVGNKAVHTDQHQPAGSTRERDVPEIVQLIAEFPSGMVMHITSSTINEVGTQEMIRGHKATLTMAGNKVELKPERPFSEEIDPETSEGFPGENVPAHHKNFFESIRANKQPNAGIDLAVRVQTVISLAEMSERLNVMCLFDEKTRKITDGSGKEIKPITYGTLELS
ncbi:MAG: Gfo/Idh/MocA family oxidoreductase [Verrucomicrobiota bacterium]